jgi:hypothetical protein
LGFQPLTLVLKRYVCLSAGVGCEWDTIGEVPEGPGHYLFAVEDGIEIRVVYVGLTQHLWMVTRGRLPGFGSPRGGQRYGRPVNAGVTRQRINMLIARELQLGRRVRHWVRRFRDPPAALDDLRFQLLLADEELINRWRLREVGWNLR